MLENKFTKIVNTAIILGSLAIAATAGLVSGQRIACPEQLADSIVIELENCSQLGEWKACDEGGVVTYQVYETFEGWTVMAVVEDSVVIFLKHDIPKLKLAGGRAIARWERPDGKHGIAISMDRVGKVENLELW